jgi:hypothetical protein
LGESKPRARTTISDLVLIRGVPVEKRLDLELVHPAAQWMSEGSGPPKVQRAECLSNEMDEGF